MSEWVSDRVKEGEGWGLGVGGGGGGVRII